MGSHLDICKNNCPGAREDGKGSCCVVEGRNWIIGTVEDSWEVLDRLQAIYPTIRYEDVFITYEEGKDLYPDKPAWQDPSCYPAMRVVNGSCKFFNLENAQFTSKDLKFAETISAQH